MSLDAFVGLPYREPYDCYGLVRAVLATQGIHLPLVQYSEDRAERAALLSAGLPGWVPVSRPQRWDVAVFRHNGRPAHVGVCIDASRFLHVEEGGTSRIERFGPLRAVEAIYRYAG